MQKYLVQYVVERETNEKKKFCGLGYRIVYGENEIKAQENFVNSMFAIKWELQQKRLFSGLLDDLEVRVRDVKLVEGFVIPEG
jgi:hypothetical protein